MVKKIAGTIVTILLLMLCACGTGPNEGDLSLISTQQEIEIGDSLSQELDAELNLINNAAVVDYVDYVGQSIVSVCERSEITYYFKVVQDDTTINAFALPGGWIYIYTGLLRRLEDESELAGVLAHEISHVVARHSAEQLTQIYGYSILVSVLLGSNPGFWEELMANLLGSAGILHFSRQNEFEADSLGTYYEYLADYDPREGMLEVLEFLQELGGTSSLLGELFSTHPPASDRIAAVQRQLENFDLSDSLMVNRDRFRDMINHLGGPLEKYKK
ncbi:M48 family metalloprotease [bacterium]|nr:M48 family metalloprotease [bacterium]